MKEPKEVSGILLNDEELDGVVGGVRITKHNTDIEMDSPSNIVRPSLNPSAAVEIPGPCNKLTLENKDYLEGIRGDAGIFMRKE